MERIEGERVTLRAWRATDADFVFELYSGWDVQRFLGHQPKVMEDRARADVLIQRLSAVEAPTSGYWAVEATSTGELIGTVMLQGIRLSGTKEPSDQIEIGWHFHPNSWGHGYATSAAALVMRHAFDSGVERLIAVVHPKNTASFRVCRRLGMKSAGVTDRYYDANYELFVLDRNQK